MKRRSFFKTAVLGGGTLALAPLASCTPLAREPEKKEEITVGSFEFDEYTVDDFQDKMRSGELTSLMIVEKYLDRIREIDQAGPGLGTVIEINPEATDIAEMLDKERKEGNIRGLLHGIPVIIKDNIDTADAMQTTAGSLAMEGFHAPQDAFIVERLREAGAILLAKANLSEWANIRSTRSTSGWSGRGGQVKNPYFLDRNPCGSSSGSAVAVSANLCCLAIGTETDGSIVCPSGINGIVGIKPTLGLWSRSGIIPIAHSQDTAGPMARTVRDAVYLLGPLRGVDNNDPFTIESEIQAGEDYISMLDPQALKGSRIGIITDFMGFHPGVDDVMKKSFNSLKDLGAELIDVKAAKSRKEWEDAEWTVLLYELKNDLNKYLAERPAPVGSLEEIIEFNNAHPEAEMPWFGQDIFLMAQEKGTLDDKEYQDALELSKRLTRETIDGLMAASDLDALVAPTNAPAWMTDWINGDQYIGGTSDLAAVSGYPSITVPAGFVHGLPVGISFIGRAWTESKLIGLAYSYEQGTRNRHVPFFHTKLG